MVYISGTRTPTMKLGRLRRDINCIPLRYTANQASIGNGLLPVEIIQHIFAYLDIWSLWNCHGVCRFWKHCVPGTSPALRTAMFLSSPEYHDDSGVWS